MFVLEASQFPQHGNDFLIKRPGKLRNAVGLQMHENVASEHVNLPGSHLRGAISDNLN